MLLTMNIKSVYEKEPVAKIIWTNGLMLWLVQTVLLVVFIYLGWHQQYRWSGVSFLNLVALFYFTGRTITQIKHLKKNYLNRFWIGLGVSIVSGVLIVGSSLVISKLIFPNFLQEQADFALGVLQSENISTDRLEAYTKMYNSPAFHYIFAIALFIKTIFCGFFASAIAALTIKSDE
jgi:hypothetical protein